MSRQGVSPAVPVEAEPPEEELLHEAFQDALAEAMNGVDRGFIEGPKSEREPIDRLRISLGPASDLCDKLGR